MDTLCFRDDHDDMSNDIRDGGKTKNSGSFSAKLHRFMIVVCVVLSLMLCWWLAEERKNDYLRENLEVCVL